ncbi:MAG: glycosyltransferase family 2 protein [Thermoplasmataceae archaeon]
MADVNNLFDIVVRTKNSARSLENCLSAIKEHIPGSNIIVIDGGSTDNTLKIAEEYHARVFLEDKGLAYATSFAGIVCKKQYILYIDSDVEIIRDDFINTALSLLEDRRVGAVIGSSLGYPFHYGIPFGLILIKRDIINKITFPEGIYGRETYYVQRYFRKARLKIKYIKNAMIHRSYSREYRFWPEWQGSYVRLTAGFSLMEVAYSLLVAFLMLSNKKKLKDFLYIPIFWGKLMRGYINPAVWSRRP